MKIMKTIFLVIIIIAIVVFIGLQIKPAPFPLITGQAKSLETIALPTGLPEPVERFYRLIYGDQIPIIETAVLSGRAELVFNGIKFPARFRFTHNAGYDYHHNIEASFFGFPIMKADESYINGYSKMVIPVGTFEGEPKLNQAANLTLWAEAIYFPAVFLSDERITWEVVDSDTALLHVPFEEEIETFTVDFDAETGFISSLAVMRYKDADSSEKTLWTINTTEWVKINEQTLPKIGSITWQDEGKPWAVFELEVIDLNVDTSFAISN